MGYSRSGFTVVGVDEVEQPHFPFEFVKSDALELSLEFLRQFDSIHASPPCQHYTKKVPTWGRRRVTWEEHPKLIAPTREFLKASGRPYILENVEGSEVRGDVRLCGSMFGLKIIKHRYFETSFPCFELVSPCDHRGAYNPWSGPGRTADKLRAAQDTPWIPMHGGASRKAGITGDLNNAIPPAYTQWLGERLRSHIEMERAA